MYLCGCSMQIAISRVEIKMVEQYEKCKHCVGNAFYYDSPYDKPESVCTAPGSKRYSLGSTQGYRVFNIDSRLNFGPTLLKIT